MYNFIFYNAGHMMGSYVHAMFSMRLPFDAALFHYTYADCVKMAFYDDLVLNGVLIIGYDL